MKTIALVELQEHQEVLFGLIDLLLEHQLDIKVFAPAQMQAELPLDWVKSEKLSWFSKSPGGSIPSFITRYKAQIDRCDLVVFTTLVSDFAFFARQSFHGKTLLLIHKGHFFFAPHQHVQLRSFKDGLRWLRSTLRRDNFWRKKMLHNLDACAFLDAAIQTNLQPLVPDGLSVLPALRFTYYTQDAPVANIPLRLVVPGTVSASTRDFDLLFAALAQVDAHLVSPITLIFLGNAGTSSARPLFKLMAKHQLQKINIQTFSYVLSHVEYTSHLQSADFLLLPLREEIRFGIVWERYGKTTISGGINDMLHFGKAMLLPAFYPLHPALDALTQRYSNADELADFLQEWVHQRIYLDRVNQAQNGLLVFSKEQVAAQLMKVLSSVK
ncbi:glycosyltransferase family 1 protein [Haliscomenobacter hydrossis]|uniref:Glycosyl transferase group 1 n=1 Tax=Haliscomenobacter hydrossis (strain ATCC 27775 / DSM 1100 / LMG 10767 / O) TaxID=760192 RepID=F4L1M1_HALH1|nr:glycosyltransferase family 1 protein [Haliscomenobacter hydrossis]AEE48565.1 hypothetical protein Halhy_0657 [Haliscomenobacter hydrossis DSM 1100]